MTDQGYVSIMANADFSFELGNYKTKERAFQILDEIQKIIKWLQRDMENVTIGDCDNLIGNFDDYVYEMSKE